MPKQKVPTPREKYWARKQVQEAYLPPGLINHGNTCFMNSVLQGLIATRLLVDLVQFNDVSGEAQERSSTVLLSRRSPQLTNGHGLGGLYEKEWVDMPIGDRFLEILYQAWRIQSGRKRENLSPKDLLVAVGLKYDQYQDSAQQDAHEFLRILLDAMRMEEQDIIKQRQPQPPKQPKKRRRSSHLTPSSTTQFSASCSTQSPSTPDPTRTSSQPSSKADTLISLPDMIFRGKLTSILVCQECKHVSQTYEDFHDISLSLNQEDYAVNHSRRRDRFRKFAKKLTAFPGTSSAVVGTSTTVTTGSNAQPSPNDNIISGSGTKDNGNEAVTLNEGLNVKDGPSRVALPIQRSSSVPPSSREREDAQISKKLLPHLISRRRSMEHLPPDPFIDGDFSSLISDPPTGDGPTSYAVRISDNLSVPANEVLDASNLEHPRISPLETKETESDDSKVTVNSTSISYLSSRVDFAAEEKPIRNHDKMKLPSGMDKKKQDDVSWTKLGRRISLSVKLGLRDKDERRNKGKRRKGKEKEEEEGKDAGVTKDEKRSVEHRFSALPIKSKSSSPITSMSDILFNSSEDPQNKTNNVLSSHAPSTAIITSVSSPGILSLSSSSNTTALSESLRSWSQPSLATPAPLHSLSVQSPNISPLSTPLQSHIQNVNTHAQAQIQKASGMQRSESPEVPKQTREEQEYLRKILADVAPVPVSSHTLSWSNGGEEKGMDETRAGTHVGKSGRMKPLTRPKTSTHLHLPGSNSRSLIQDDHSTPSVNTNIGKWLPLAAVSQFSGLEECLRKFTAVEELNGENMVGCRRCWKIQNGYMNGMKSGEDSGDEDDEEKASVSEYETEAKNKLLAPPLKPLDSRSSQSSNATFASDESGWSDVEKIGEIDTLLNSTITASQSQSLIPLSVVTPTITTSDEIILTPDVETPKAPSAHPAPPAEDKLHPDHIPPVPELSGSTSSTANGISIPRISTTPAIDTLPNGSISGDNNGDKDREADDNSDIRTPGSTSSQSSSIYDYSTEGSATGTDSETKNVQRRQGIIFSDSLVVPMRMSGQLRPSGIRRTSIESDGSADTPASLSLSATSTEESDSGEENAVESASDTGREAQFISPFAPPGLEYEGYPSLTHSIPPVYDVAAKTVPSSMSETQPPTPKIPANVKKKQERILRPAYKRYLISIPPPVLVIHLKRFQQLNPSGSSPLSSFAERLASGFSTHQSSSRGSRYVAYGGGFGGIGRGGFRKLEEFVSFPECLDLSPFLEPMREEDTVSSKSCRHDGARDEDGRCMYRLYAVVVHIGDMLGGHYISYVALPDKPPLTDAHDHGINDIKVNVGEKTAEKGGSDESADLDEKCQTTKRQWAYISDTNVRLASLDEVLNARAYICKYERI